MLDLKLVIGAETKTTLGENKAVLVVMSMSSPLPSSPETFSSSLASLRGEEKRASSGSIPCSSRTPVSLRTIPVLLETERRVSWKQVASTSGIKATTYRPATPSSYTCSDWGPRVRRCADARGAIFSGYADDLVARGEECEKQIQTDQVGGQNIIGIAVGKKKFKSVGGEWRRVMCWDANTIVNARKAMHKSMHAIVYFRTRSKWCRGASWCFFATGVNVDAVFSPSAPFRCFWSHSGT